MTRWLAILSILSILLSACTADDGAFLHLPHVIASPADATADPAETLAFCDTEPPETTAPPEPEPLALPESVVTNIRDDEIRALISEAAAICEEHGLSVSWISGDGAHRFSVNGGELYPSASTIKAVYCQYLLSAGKYLSREVVFDTKLARTSTTGLFTEEKKGTVFTVAELMEYAVRFSDNMAYRLLFSTYGRESYNEWVESLGIPGLQFPTGYEFIDVCADDLSAAMLEIYRFSASDDRLVQLMLASDYKKQIASGTDYDVASKYGFEGWTNGYHDTAIVFAPHPYVLTVMSRIFPYDDGANEPFAAITALCDRINAQISGE